MQSFTENQIRQLHTEFRGLKKYMDKLAFFDRLFGIIPFSFPDFDPGLGFLFQKEKTEELTDIFKRERNNPALTEKKFSFSEDFHFNIKPANSNSSAYSNYILTNFLNRAPVFEEWIRQKKSLEKPIDILLEEANGLVNQIEYYLQNEYDKSFRLQCMSVFYKGFYVAFCNHPFIPDKKRKFIELYLYAQGMIYTNYISALKTALYKSLNPLDSIQPVHLDLPGKLGLMNELGIIELLRTRYAGIDGGRTENKIAELLCLLMGEYEEQKEPVVRILSVLLKQSPAGLKKQHPDATRRKIKPLNLGK